MRIINADDLKDLMYIACMGQDKAFVKVFEQVIDDCPTIEPESLIPHGKWIEYEASDSDLDPRCRCSKCGSVETPLARHSYCPNCGAKMDKEGPDAG